MGAPGIGVVTRLTSVFIGFEMNTSDSAFSR